MSAYRSVSGLWNSICCPFRLTPVIRNPCSLFIVLVSVVLICELPQALIERPLRACDGLGHGPRAQRAIAPIGQPLQEPGAHLVLKVLVRGALHLGEGLAQDSPGVSRDIGWTLAPLVGRVPALDLALFTRPHHRPLLVAPLAPSPQRPAGGPSGASAHRCAPVPRRGAPAQRAA